MEKEIPVQFSLNVSGPTNVTLSQQVTIDGALVTVQTGGLNITNARATIVLPQGVVLPINIENLVVPVDQKCWQCWMYQWIFPLSRRNCMNHLLGCSRLLNPGIASIEPDATVNGLQVCAPDPTLVDPALLLHL